MSAADHLGPQFGVLHQRVLENHLGVDPHSPRSCAGRCDEVSEHVQAAARAVGIHPVPGRMRVSNDDYRKDHVVNVHKGNVIDYTLRQFEPDAAVPHVEPIKSYMEKRGYYWAAKD